MSKSDPEKPARKFEMPHERLERLEIEIISLKMELNRIFEWISKQNDNGSFTHQPNKVKSRHEKKSLIG